MNCMKCGREIGENRVFCDLCLADMEKYPIKPGIAIQLHPRGKKYDMEQLCRIINLNLLKGGLPLEQCCSLMTYINGCLADESDDLVDDSKLYFMFVRLAARARQIGGNEDWDEALQEVTADYREPVPGAREKLIKVLRIMLTVWMANSLRTSAETMIAQL